MASEDFNPQRVTIVDLGLDFCENSFGQSPCTATRCDGCECYNTYYTCQDPTNFDAGTKYYRFTFAFGNFIKNVSSFRSLVSLKRIPGKIDQNRGLGGRDKVTFVFQDFLHDDTAVDPYVKGRPVVRGFFWRKLLARNPYHIGRPIYIRTGYLDEQGKVVVDNMVSQRYEVESIKLDARGKVTVVAKDILKKLDRSMIPAQTDGELTQQLLAAGNYFSVASGKGAQYDVYGAPPYYVRIDDELMAISSRSTDTFTVSARGQLGSTAADHNDGARVQIVREYDGLVDEVWADILEDGGIDSSLIDTTSAAADRDIWLTGVTAKAYLSVPRSASTRVQSLLESFSCMNWWDSVEQVCKFKSVHPTAPGETKETINGESDLIRDSVRVAKLESDRLTRVVTYFGVGDWSKDVTKFDVDKPAYQRIIIVADADAESSLEFGDVAVKEIFNFWSEADAENELTSIAQRRLSKNVIPINSVRAQTTEHKATVVDLGALVDVTVDEVVATNGVPEQREYLVVQRVPPQDDKIRYTYLVEETAFGSNFGFWAQDTTSDFPDNGDYATWTDTNGLNSDGTPGSTWF